MFVMLYYDHNSMYKPRASSMRYEKGQREATRQRIIDTASGRFRSEGIAASGLAAIMSDAGLTNGAFYPHFDSKAELVRESVAAAMDGQSERLRDLAEAGGVEAVIAAYLSPQHRDNPDKGCALAALLPELAREPASARAAWAKNFQASVQQLASALPHNQGDREDVALALYSLLIGTLQLARATQGTPLSDRILKSGTDAARAFVGLPHPAQRPRKRANRAKRSES